MDQAETLLGLWVWRQHDGFQHTLMKEMPGTQGSLGLQEHTANRSPNVDGDPPG